MPGLGGVGVVSEHGQGGGGLAALRGLGSALVLPRLLMVGVAGGGGVGSAGERVELQGRCRQGVGSALLLAGERGGGMVWRGCRQEEEEEEEVGFWFTRRVRERNGVGTFSRDRRGVLANLSAFRLSDLSICWEVGGTGRRFSRARRFLGLPRGKRTRRAAGSGASAGWIRRRAREQEEGLQGGGG